MRVAVVGGGPSGLVTLKYLKTAHQFFPGMEPIEAKLFEAKSHIGGTFKYRAYEDAEAGSRDKSLTLAPWKNFNVS
jgi:dimethylaniline monooxygenase (N-oxide forming)